MSDIKEGIEKKSNKGYKVLTKTTQSHNQSKEEVYHITLLDRLLHLLSEYIFPCYGHQHLLLALYLTEYPVSIQPFTNN